MISKLTGLMFSAAAMTPWAAWAGSTVGPSEGYRHGGHMMGGGHMFFGPVMMLLAIAVIVIIVVLVVRWTGSPGHSHHGPSTKTPQDILKERYARGELSTKEFEERRKVLGD
jgi:putative membrane protein